jgi:hypothetical protein
MEDDFHPSPAGVVDGVIDELGQGIMNDSIDILGKSAQKRDLGRSFTPDRVFLQALQGKLQPNRRCSLADIAGRSTPPLSLEFSFPDEPGKITMGRLSGKAGFLSQQARTYKAIFVNTLFYDFKDLRHS